MGLRIRWTAVMSAAMLCVTLQWTVRAEIGPETSSNKKQNKAKTPTVKQSGSPRLFLGVLRANRVLGLSNPSEYCLPDGYLYEGAAYRVNGVNVFVAKPQQYRAWIGRTVLLEGSMQRDLTKILKRKKKCPRGYGRRESMMQLRSDWMARETGFSVGRSTPQRLKKVSYLKIKHIRLSDTIDWKRAANGGMTLRIKNTFKFPLEKMTVIYHYEMRGRGKPSPIYVRKRIVEVKPGQAWEDTVSLIHGESVVKKPAFQAKKPVQRPSRQQAPMFQQKHVQMPRPIPPKRTFQKRRRRGVLTSIRVLSDSAPLKIMWKARL